MSDYNPSALYDQYLDVIKNDYLPWWYKHGLDFEYGGFLSCMQENGTRVSEDKYMWSQGRGLWIFSYLYKNIDPDPRHREFIDLTSDFLVRHGRTADGKWVNRVSRTGEQLDGPTSIYADMFVALGLVEHYRATGNEESLAIARETAREIAIRLRAPDFTDVAPFNLKPGYKLQGPHFINLNMLTPLLTEIDDPFIEEEAARDVSVITERFMDYGRGINVEMLDPDWQVTDFPQGRDYVPGHGVECAWILMHEAMRKKDEALWDNAFTVLRWHIEKGWDTEEGGLFWWLNIDGEEPFEKNWTAKLWWPHAESFIALANAVEHTGDDYWKEWYMRLHDYSFATFPNRENGEWTQRLDRYGKPITATLVLPVKDPFHMPRGLVLAMESLKRQMN